MIINQDTEIYPWGHNRRFNDYPTYIKKQFGGRIQKISINVGFSCPNRDGSKGTGGCIYCNNQSFRPDYCRSSETVTQQIESGKRFFAPKYPDMRYIAYFQSYTNTYASVKELELLYREAIEAEGVTALIIGTRPDCISPAILDILVGINQKVPVAIEFGMESTCNETLLEINRCHTWEDSVDAVMQCHQRGLTTGGHLILGLPGEDRETILAHATRISSLPLDTLKLHQLQIIKNTELARRYHDNPTYVELFTLDEYIQTIIAFLELLNPKIVIERFVSVSPGDKLIAPRWNRMKNFEVVARIEKELARQDTWQGRLFEHV
jgi:uncharacterized protein